MSTPSFYAFNDEALSQPCTPSTSTSQAVHMDPYAVCAPSTSTQTDYVGGGSRRWTTRANARFQPYPSALPLRRPSSRQFQPEICHGIQGQSVVPTSQDIGTASVPWQYGPQAPQDHREPWGQGIPMATMGPSFIPAHSFETAPMSPVETELAFWLHPNGEFTFSHEPKNRPIQRQWAPVPLYPTPASSSQSGFTPDPPLTTPHDVVYPTFADGHSEMTVHNNFQYPPQVIQLEPGPQHYINNLTHNTRLITPIEIQCEKVHPNNQVPAKNEGPSRRLDDHKEGTAVSLTSQKISWRVSTRPIPSDNNLTSDSGLIPNESRNVGGRFSILDFAPADSSSTAMFIFPPPAGSYIATRSLTKDQMQRYPARELAKFVQKMTGLNEGFACIRKGCYHVADSRVMLAKHFRKTDHRGDGYNCEWCPEPFTRLDHLEKHFKQSLPCRLAQERAEAELSG